MSEIIVMNGPAGVGKTTLARLLADRLSGTVCIHGDEIAKFAPPDARHHLGPGSTYRAGAALVSAYLEMDAPRVIFEYVFPSADQITYLCRHLPVKSAVFMVTIWAPFEVVRKRESARPDREPLGARVRETYDALERNLGELGHIVDNTGPPDAAVSEIADHVASARPHQASDFVG